MKEEINMKKKDIYEKVTRRLGLLDLDILVNAASFEIRDFELDGRSYSVPIFIINNFDGLFHGKTSIHKSEHTNRSEVYTYAEAVLKSARKVLPSINLNGEMSVNSNSHFDKLCAEVAYSQRLRAFGLKIVVPIGVIKSENHDKPYLVERRYWAMPFSAGKELKESSFSNGVDFANVVRAYDEFVAHNKSKGFTYNPLNSDRPYADLVRRSKSDGEIELLATDWPMFEKSR